MCRLLFLTGSTVALSCTSNPPPAFRYPAMPSSAKSSANHSDDSAHFGGRLFDNFWKELKLDFVPDDPKTPVADGKGGPFGNGTLPDHEGKPLLNNGHNYRLKNLLGWDLHGAQGVSGQHFRETHCVLLPDLLKNTDTRQAWVDRLTKGEDAIPAYGSVLSATQIDALVDFLLGVRDGALPQPDELFTLDEKVPGFYRLDPRGDAARGHAIIASSCANCHGKDGTAFPLEHGELSLGTFLRTSAAEAWLKILNGVPATSMHPQLAPGSRAEQTQQLQDLFAAGCDRTRYPRGNASAPDVPDGDARCGRLLK